MVEHTKAEFFFVEEEKDTMQREFVCVYVAIKV